MSNWVEAYYDYQQPNDNAKGTPCVVFEFKTEADAKEFLRSAKICKEVNDELLFYGEGVLRTVKRGRHGKGKAVRKL